MKQKFIWLFLIFNFLLIGCGKISMIGNVENSTLPEENQDIFYRIDTDPSRMISKNNQEIDIQSYSNSSIMGSGIYYQALIMPPVKQNIVLNAIATTSENFSVYVGYRGLNSEDIPNQVDIIKTNDPFHPSIQYSYELLNYSIVDLKIKNDWLFILANSLNQTESSLLVINLLTKNEPEVVSINNFSNSVGRNLDLLNNTLMVANSEGTLKFDITNPRGITLAKIDSIGSLFFGKFNILYNILLTSVSNTFFSVMFSNNSQVNAYSVNNLIDQESVMVQKNSLIYLNNSDVSLSILDISPVIKNQSINSLSNLTLFGESKGISIDQQKIYLAQGSEGTLIANSYNPSSPQLDGKLLFYDGIEFTDNSWTYSRIGYKIILVNDQYQGLRFLAENYNYQSNDEITLFARGANTSSTPSQVLIRINGENFQTLTLDNTGFQTYVVTYSRPLVVADEVEAILLNIPTQSAFISYIKINNRYCYQEIKNNKDSIGLLTPLQTIKASQNSCDSYDALPICISGIPKIPSETCNLSNHRLGIQTCDNSGMDYVCEDSGQCESGYTLSAGICVPQVCSPNTYLSCSDSISSRTKQCNSSGTGYGSCDLVSCNTGYVEVANQCEIEVCAIGSSTTCSIANGSGMKLCNSNGTDYGFCILNSCDAGYYNNNGVCSPQICTPNSSSSCISNHFIGTQTCNSDGSSLGLCVTGGSCETGYTLNAGICVPQSCVPSSTISCSENNGSGTKICNISGLNYDNCILNSCDFGYTLSSETCIPQVCSPNSTTACSESNGSGTKTCASDGMSYGSCSISGCNSGYVLNNGVCEDQICTPNSSVACTGTNGSGTKMCDTQGLNYGNCVINSCNSGYYLDNGICTVQVCSPYSSQSCVDNHFFGNRTCNSQGSAYGSCVTGSTCESGYSNDNGVCVPQTCTPSSTQACTGGNGSGTQTCNANGLGYGSCNLTSCNSGYYLDGGSCVPQTCTPNSSTSCSDSTGSGTKTCNSSGSAYGSCSFSSCNSGYYLNNGMCVPQVCTPNSTASCPITNGSGLKTCNSTGSAYGACTVSSCSSDAYQSGNTCVLYCPDPLLVHVVVLGVHLCL